MGHQVGQEVLVGNQVVQEVLVDRKKVPEADQAEEEAQVLEEEVQKGVGEEAQVAQVAQVAQPAGEDHRSSLAVGSNSTRSRSSVEVDWLAFPAGT